MDDSTMCPLCAGRGAFIAPHVDPCPRCQGHGTYTPPISAAPSRMSGGRMPGRQFCPDCQGTGGHTVSRVETCRMCQGTGSIPREDLAVTQRQLRVSKLH
jgi:RecJ-like exonuclease